MTTTTDQPSPAARFRESIASLIAGRSLHADTQALQQAQADIEALQETTRSVWNAYLEGSHVLTPEELVRQLKEQSWSTSILQDLLYQMSYDIVGTTVPGLTTARTAGERARAIIESRRQWKYSPLTQWSINLWTNYGFGQKIEIVPTDEKELSRETWAEFWDAERNEAVLAEDNIHDLSNNTLVDGDKFLVYYASTIDGKTTIVSISPDEIKEIITHPDNASWPVFYKREWIGDRDTPQVRYYPDHMLFFAGKLDEPLHAGESRTLSQYLNIPDDKRADKIHNGLVPGLLEQDDVPGTLVCMQHIAYNRKDQASLWGWPLPTTALPWTRAHRQYMQDRLGMTASKNSYARRLSVQGGSRAVDAIRSTVESALSQSRLVDTNPPAVAGATAVTNRAIDWEELPIRTGADDAKTDEEMFSWIAALALGVFPHYAGKGDAYRLATASAMERPLWRQWNRYRLFWSAQFRRMAKIVLRFKELSSPGGEIGKDHTLFKTYKIEINTDKLVEADLPKMSEAIARWYRDVLMPLADFGDMPQEIMDAINAFTTRAMLDALGAGPLTEEITKEALEKARDAQEKQDAEDAQDQGDEQPPDEGAEEEDQEEGIALPDNLIETLSHAGTPTEDRCPLCGYAQSYQYEGHPDSLRVCADCQKTFDLSVE